ncbi:MAG: peptide chain release factor 2 [bacterium]|nr:peptide chain release factor 2 [bacterium]
MQAELKQKIKHIKNRIIQMRGYLDIENRKLKLKEYEGKMSAADFWADQSNAKKILREIKDLKDIIEPLEKAENDLKDLESLLDLCSDDESLSGELSRSMDELESVAAKLEFSRLLSLPDDTKNAVVTIHSGAGGTEACDWTEMLYRMYSRWCERKNFKIETMDFQPGDEAGIKSITLIVSGMYAYGFLRVEAGVHRLVRISPFDANKRRHTSFASVDVIPEADDDMEITINPEELRIDTYRASGAGGQHVNKTDSAVRITHIPTGIVTQCQEDRSQHKNKANAMRILKSKLYEKYLSEKEEELAKRRGVKKKIEWGSQIRSYVFHPYSLVKDHRTGAETSNIGAVMDGEIDLFVDAGLKWVVS